MGIQKGNGDYSSSIHSILILQTLKMSKNNSRRRVLQLTGITIASSLSGCAGILGRNKTTTSPETTTPSAVTQTSTLSQQTTEQETRTTTTERKIQIPTGMLKQVTIPSSPSDYTYPVMGRADAPVTATVYGSWKCPYTQEFVHGYLQTIAKKFVQPGNLLLQFREVAYDNGEPFHGKDELTAAHAGLAIWDYAPERFWQYFAYLFANQGNSANPWATPNRLIELAQHADVANVAAIRKKIQSTAYKNEIRNTMKKVNKHNITAVPRVVVRGNVTAPTANPKRTKKQLTKALANN